MTVDYWGGVPSVPPSDLVGGGGGGSLKTAMLVVASCKSGASVPFDLSTVVSDDIGIGFASPSLGIPGAITLPPGKYGIHAQIIGTPTLSAVSTNTGGNNTDTIVMALIGLPALTYDTALEQAIGEHNYTATADGSFGTLSTSVSFQTANDLSPIDSSLAGSFALIYLTGSFEVRVPPWATFAPVADDLTNASIYIQQFS